MTDSSAEKRRELEERLAALERDRSMYLQGSDEWEYLMYWTDLVEEELERLNEQAPQQGTQQSDESTGAAG